MDLFFIPLPNKRENIPQNWIDSLARKEDILDLAARFIKANIVDS
jgi:hypothetical protein